MMMMGVSSNAVGNRDVISELDFGTAFTRDSEGDLRQVHQAAENLLGTPKS